MLGGSIDGYAPDGSINAILFGDAPDQECVYVYELSDETFSQTQIDRHQYVSEVAVKPLGVQKVKISEYMHLFRKATAEETAAWLEKYG